MNKSEFTAKVAEDIVLKQHPGAKNWAPHNLWAHISTVRWQITDKQMPTLMKSYGVHKLEDFPPKEVTLQ